MTTRNCLYRTVFACVLGAPVGIVAAQDAPGAADRSAAGETAELEEIVVVGVRASLTLSRDIKRESTIVQDSIVAEDLGRFPDANVADSLSHIPGITLQRTRGGEGQYVNVRGLGPAYSIVTLNDRILATDGDGREFAFDVLPAEVIHGADVFKSSQASLIEGSIGGTVNLTSARPLANPGMHASLTAEGDYNDLSEDSGYKFTGVFSDTFADDTVGVLLSAVYSDVEVRSDAVHEFFINPDQPGAFDADGDGELSEHESDLLGLCCTSFGSRIQQKERSAITGTVQWEPTDTVKLTLDGLFSRLDAPTVGYHQSYYVEDSILDEDTGEHRWSDVSISDHWVTDMTVAELIPEASTITEYRVVDTSQFGLNGKWKATERLRLDGDVYYSKSERDSGGKDTWVVSGIAGDHTGRMHMNRNALPDISVALEDGRDLATALEAGELGNADYGLHYIGLSGTDVTDEVTGATLGGTIDVNWRALSTVDVGVSNTVRTKVRNTIENDTNGGSCQYCNMYDTTFESLGADVTRSLRLPNFMRNAGGQHPHRFVSFDVRNYLRALQALDGPEYVDAEGNTQVFDSSLTRPEFNPVQSYDVEEDTTAFYVQGNFKGEKWFANAGVRWINTDTTAKTAINRIVSVVDPTPGVPTSSPDVTYSEAEPLKQEGSYDKWLPSLNAGYWVTPDVLVRFAAAQVIARPSLNQLAPTAVDNTLDRTYAIFYDGAADLEPTEADQVDLSVEWYFDERSIVNAAVFWKDISNFITYALDENVDIGVVGQIGTPPVEQPILYDVSHPINGDSADVFGIELGFQHFFANGFGVRGSYTFTDTTAYIDGEDVGQLEGVSESAWSAALIYEDERWSAQLAADYSGEYTEAIDAVGGRSQIADPITWVTASVAYKVTDTFTVSLEGRNLLDEYYWATLDRADMPAGFETWGRTYVFSLIGKF
jgi:iron complex outermembrane receptor protein